MNMVKNKCVNEADVEALIVEPFLRNLGYNEEHIKRKRNIDELTVAKGSKKELYKPDYVLLIDGLPSVVIDAKAPSETLESFNYQVSGYALSLNKGHENINPCQYCVLINDKNLLIYKWDEVKPIKKLKILDKKIDFPLISLKSIKKEFSEKFTQIPTAEKNITIKLKKPSRDEIIKCFSEIHNFIWKREGCNPTDAFYEFVKLFTLKMDNDKKMHKIIDSDIKLTHDDIYFSTAYIDKQLKLFPKDDPIKSRFDSFKKELDEQIKNQGKKRIFPKEDKLELKSSTIKEVVKKLEKYDLYGIDEDLNGRMFEVFLRAAVRGKELGQYFTPRDVVKFMVKLASPDEHTRVLDACCGSGGFLIEAMSFMLKNIKEKSIPSKTKEELYKRIQQDLIIGVEKSKKVCLTSRMNMYVHKDGSSRIFNTDSLDKHIKIEDTDDEEHKQQLTEAKEILRDKSIQIVLTNPPFSSKYSFEDENEKRVLDNYDVCNRKTGKYKSNILFIERYYDLLEIGGKLITVIDDSLINGKNEIKFRNWIKERFHIKAVVSLPFNTFINASTTIKTSILYLEKKEFNEESTNDVFMAICNNIGHDDSGKESFKRNNLLKVMEEYENFSKGKKIEDIIIENQDEREMLTCPLQIFTVNTSRLINRWDAFYYSPVLTKIRRKIKGLKTKGFTIIKGNDLTFIKTENKNFEEVNCSNVFKYIEVGSVNKKGDIVKIDTNTLSSLPTRARLRLEEFSVITPKNISSLYSTVIINSNDTNLLCSTGFIAIQPKNKNDAIILWAILRSSMIQEQMYYLSATAVQPEISITCFKSDVIIPIPNTSKSIKTIYEKAKKIIDKRKEIDTLFNDLNDVF